MKLEKLTKKVLVAVLALSAWTGFAVPVVAEETEVPETEKTPIGFEKTDIDIELSGNKKTVNESAEQLNTFRQYADNDIVRVSIVLMDMPALSLFPSENIGTNSGAINYRDSLERTQKELTARIENKVLGGKKLDVVWNLTLAANMISANVEYGKIEAIKGVPGVKNVVLETRYTPAVVESGGDNPNMATSSRQIGTAPAYAAGYTGAGSRIAIIDTGIDTDHQSFASDSFEYSLQKNAEEKGVSYDEYVSGLDLLDADEISSVLSQLNAVNASASDLYVSSKIPFGYNYVVGDLDIVHVNDKQGEHGSHVSGIAAANKYVSKDGSYVSALDSVLTQGVAPDAQILTMKVFGQIINEEGEEEQAGAYDSDYMAAIEDAIVLGADSINLSLGSGMPGFAEEYSYEYQHVLDSLEEADVVVTISAGNAGYYTENDMYAGSPYFDESYFDEVGSPGSYTNSLSVASVDNVGFTGDYFTIAGENIFYTETIYTNKPFRTLAGTKTYIMIDGIGSDEDFEEISSVLAGNIAVCYRGETSFFEKATAAVKYGAIGTIIVNNQAGTIAMNLTGYTKPEPVVSVTKATGDSLKANATQKEINGAVYYEGTIDVGSEAAVDEGDESASPESGYVMSSFSSWGVPGSLELKPEVVAPGGNIYSVFGTNKTETGAIAGGTDKYESMSGTSMAAPQVTGMAALIAQYIKENGLAEQTGLSVRQLSQSLLMSTSQPMTDDESGSYYSILQQGSGVANVGNAVSAKSYILMDESSTASAADGKVKAELGEDADRSGVYEYTFTINNMSDEDIDYTFDTDFFTQDTWNYDSFLDTYTKPLGANVTYTIDGEEFVPGVKIAADVDKDGDTDQDDARCVLKYCIDLEDGSAYDLDAADIDKDGEVTTYDAHQILLAIDEAGATVPAKSSVTVTVTAAISDADKADMDKITPNGAWIEGYTYIKPASTAEGVIQDVEHSVPVLAYYGNYTDSAMFDFETNVSLLSGEFKRYPHSAELLFNEDYVQSMIDAGMFGDDFEYTAKDVMEEFTSFWNAWIYSDGYSAYIYTINPYAIEDSVPYGREAINSANFIYYAVPRLMRNSRALLAVVMDEDGEILACGDLLTDAFGVAYYSNYQLWLEVTQDGYLNFYGGNEPEFRIAPEDVGIEEGEKITYAVVAVPEYYLLDKDTVTAQDVVNLIESGTLGKGAYLSQTFTVDDTAPDATGIYMDEDPEDEESVYLEIDAVDNNYVAYAALLDANYKLLAGALPQQKEAGEEATALLHMKAADLSNIAYLYIADYADNISVYSLAGGNSETAEPEAENDETVAEAPAADETEVIAPVTGENELPGVEIIVPETEEPETVEETAEPAEEESEDSEEITLGGLNNINVDDPENDVANEDGTVTVDITATDSTNGLFTVAYDPSVLTYKTTTSNQDYWYVNVDEEAGTVKVDFAAVEAQNGVVATVKFTYDSENLTEPVTDITVTAEEDGDSTEPAEQEVDVRLGYEVTIETGEGGTTDQGETVIVKEGGKLKIKITPNNGYAIDQVLVNGKPVTVNADGTVEIEVDEDITVKVTFKKVTSPDTSDSNNNALWAGIFGTALLAAVGVWFIRRRGENIE